MPIGSSRASAAPRPPIAISRDARAPEAGRTWSVLRWRRPLRSKATSSTCAAGTEAMEKFTVHKGLVAPMDRANVDTDAIIPKQFLKSIHRTGFGPNLFDAWRYKDEGQPGRDNSGRPLNPDFVLNQPRFKGATILIAR